MTQCVICGIGRALHCLIMMDRMTKKRRLVAPLVALLVLGAIGCSNVDASRSGSSDSTLSRRHAGSSQSNAPQSFQSLCAEIEQQNGQGSKRSVAEYSKLQDLLRSMSPLVQAESQSTLQQAHASALRTANGMLLNYLRSSQHNPQHDDLKRSIRREIHYDRLKYNEEDLKLMLNKVLNISDGSACANFYLEMFYTQYIRNLDLFGSIVFGSTVTPSQPDTLGLSVTVPPDVSNASPTWDRTGSNGSALWITLLRWEVSPILTSVLQSLENRAHDPSRGGLVIDLRFAGGTDPASLAKVRESAGRGWGGLSMIILTSYETRGLAAVWATEMSNKPNVEVWGTSPEIYGYGRKLRQQSATLAEGTSEVNVTIGYEYLQPGGNDSNRDGYRLRLRAERVLPSIGVKQVDDTILRADKFSQSNAVTDPPSNENREEQPQPELQQQAVVADNLVTRPFLLRGL